MTHILRLDIDDRTLTNLVHDVLEMGRLLIRLRQVLKIVQLASLTLLHIVELTFLALEWHNGRDQK
jgi:hypothetical protein